jgi:hypothetical protein
MGSYSKDIYSGIPAGTTALDRQRFAKWVQTVSSKGSLGLVSGRFYCKYLDHGKLFPLSTATELRGEMEPGSMDCNVQVGPLSLLDLEPTKHQSIKKSLASFSLADTSMDCWIRNENLQETMIHCFKEFEKVAGVGAVDWTGLPRFGDPARHINPSNHVECKNLYDDELAAYVSRSEPGVLRAFDYKRC